MLELSISTPDERRPRHMLCLGAHCDDIDIGCGGTILKLLSTGSWEVTWVAFSSTAERAREFRQSARRFLRRAVRSRVLTFEFRDTYFPAEYSALKRTFDTLKNLPSPSLVFTHHRADLHQDHRIVGELTWNAFRRHLILEYEIPKYEGALSTPNAYVRLTRAQAMAKARSIVRCYPSQHGKPWFTQETFIALMHLRGVEAGAGTRWAEGFHAAKFCIA